MRQGVVCPTSMLSCTSLHTMKPCGNIDESWNDYVSANQQAATEYVLTTRQKLQFLHNFLRGDAKRRNAVVRCSWTTKPLSPMANHDLSFQKLYGELEAAHQLERESKLAKIRKRNVGKFETKIAGLLFTYQGRYVYSNRGRGRGSTARKGTFPESIDTLIILGCFNCDDPSHMANDCPKPLNSAKAAEKKCSICRKDW